VTSGRWPTVAGSSLRKSDQLVAEAECKFNSFLKNIAFKEFLTVKICLKKKYFGLILFFNCINKIYDCLELCI
jgi:hypothetical protein